MVLLLFSTQIEGQRKKHTPVELLDHPELRFTGVQSEQVHSPPMMSVHLLMKAFLSCRTPSDLYVTCQLIADNKPLTIPYRTSFKAFKMNVVCVEFQQAFSSSHLIHSFPLAGMNGLAFLSNIAIYH